MNPVRVDGLRGVGDARRSGVGGGISGIVVGAIASAREGIRRTAPPHIDVRKIAVLVVTVRRNCVALSARDRPRCRVPDNGGSVIG